MVTINLLPWRETKLKKTYRRFIVQSLVLLSFTLVLSGLLWAKNTNLIDSQRAALKVLRTDNYEIFSELEHFHAAQQKYLKQQQRTKTINQLIGERQSIPQLLATLGNKKWPFQVNYLLVDHDGIKLKGADASTDSVLSQLNILREESVFCQVIFTPFESNQTTSIIEFELQAKICDEHIDK